MIIQHNMISSNMSRQLKITNKRLDKSGEKLSSGFSINRAADNAAGLTISEKMRGQIRGLNQASRNIDDGISYIQVADGALSEVQDILQRINVLTVQAANDTYVDRDRKAVNEEIQQLKAEINRIFSDTEFNTKRIWEEDPETRVQIGTEILPAITITGINTTGILNQINKEAIPSNNRYNLLADENGIAVTWDAYNGASYTSDTIEWSDVLTGSHSFNLSDYIDVVANPELAGLDFTFSYNVIEAATLDDVIDSINGEYVPAYISNSVQTTIYSDDGSGLPGISMSSSINYPALLGSKKDFDQYDDLFIEGGVNGVLNENNLIVDPTEASPSDKWVFEFDMANIGTVRATSYSTTYYSYWKDPDKKWWDVTDQGYEYVKNYSPSPGDGSLNSINNSLVNEGLDLLNDTSGEGGYIRVNFNLVADSPFTLANGSSYSNVGSMTMTVRVYPDDTIDTVNERLNKMVGFDIYAGNKATNAPTNTYYQTMRNNADGVLIESPIYQSVLELNIQSGANQGQAIKLIYKSLNNHSLGINNINSLTREASETGISQVAKALSIVSEQRSEFGAYQNRLGHAKSNADNMSENTQRSESKIRDTDMAKEIVEFTKNKILQDATHALLTHARQIPERVLFLLK